MSTPQSVLPELGDTGRDVAIAKALAWWQVIWHGIHAGTLPNPPKPGMKIAVAGVNELVTTPDAPTIVLKADDVPMPPPAPKVEPEPDPNDGAPVEPATAAEKAVATAVAASKAPEVGAEGNQAA